MSAALATSTAPRKRLGPYSRPRALARMDGRTKEARFLRDTRADLLRHVGGTPTVVQAALIERAVILSLRVAQMDAKAADGGVLTEHDSRTYLAWSNHLTRTLRQLGLKGGEGTAPRSLRDAYPAKAGTAP